ncbi:VWA domain-containing protein [Paraburkholderia sp. SARCC-3016]|uniref:vWA domain-containing protein n=1 Tax=Paraburkholderia sp. SARCC-3016 TaxID=3058611 RepID=UPI0028081A13|nr:VWA domain-containing protein [Paraburkholderia sp. SARCC-3016]MDQ7978951.1 VWA domain-containing protein [Paraburkholderia sp. SARCC-3016]
MRIEWPRTLAAKGMQRLHADHLRFAREAPPRGVLHCFVLDCSGSMLAGARLALAKGLLAALFARARADRHEAALICFGGVSADLRFGPAIPRGWSERWLDPIGGGGGTPFAPAIERAARLLAGAARRKPGQQRWLWVLSDGRSVGMPVRPDAAHRVVFVDFESNAVRLGRCAQLAHAWDGEYVTPRQLIAADG